MTSQVDCGIALELADLVPAIGFFELLVTTGRTGFFVLGAGALDADRPKRPMSAMMWHLHLSPKNVLREHRLVQALRGDTQNVDALIISI